jgi:plastocyanin
MLRRAILGLFVLTFFAPALFAAVGVSIEDNFYTQKDITVPAGTMVVWTDNGSSLHTVTSGTVGAASGLFDSGTLSTGNKFSFTFTKAGTFPYFCKFHGNVGMVGSVTVTCSTKAQLLKNPGFESGNVSWNASAATIINNGTAFPPHAGNWKAQLNGKGTANTQSIFQQVAVPANACTATVSFFLRIATTDSGMTANDTLKVQIVDGTGKVLKNLGTFSNLNKSTNYVKKQFNVIAFKGKTIRVKFIGTENGSLKTTFLVDDVALSITK